VKESFNLIIQYFKRYKSHFFIGVIGLFLVDGLQIFIPWMVKRSIDLITETPENYQKILEYGAYIVLLAVGVGLSRLLWRYYIIGMSRRIELHLRNRLYHHLQYLSYSYFDTKSVGDLMAHATNDLEAIRMMCGIAIVASMDSALLMIASLIMMTAIDFTLTLYVLIPLPIITVVVLRLGPLMYARFMNVQKKFSDISEKAQETFAGIRVIKSFVQENKESDNFSKINQEYVDANMRLVKIWGLLHPLIWTIGGLCGVIILYIGGIQVINGQITMGDFVAFNSYLGILMWPMIAIGWVANLYQRGKASLERINTILNVQPQIVNAPDSVPLNIQGLIEFKDLTFSYNDTDIVLKNINLKIQKGEWIAIMGPTGCSKTSLVNLIARLYDPPAKSLYIDGVDIRTIRLDSLRQQIGYVPQQTFLFSDTIANNIRFGMPLTNQEIEDFAKAADVYEDINLFPERFETLVGERGITLSGGQKQRVAIARAMAADTAILIFDDSLSAVDTKTEETIISNLKKVAENRTVILVSHRVSTAREADTIVFMEDGEIIEQGTHSELVALKESYFKVYEYQRLEEELDKVTESDTSITQESDSDV